MVIICILIFILGFFVENMEIDCFFFVCFLYYLRYSRGEWLCLRLFCFMICIVLSVIFRFIFFINVLIFVFFNNVYFVVLFLLVFVGILFS